MNNQRDIIIWKLGEDLAKARLALGKIHVIIDKVPFWNADIAEIEKVLREFIEDGEKIERRLKND